MIDDAYRYMAVLLLTWQVMLLPGVKCVNDVKVLSHFNTVGLWGCAICVSDKMGAWSPLIKTQFAHTYVTPEEEKCTRFTTFYIYLCINISQ